MSQVRFAEAIGMNPRTFARRLAGHSGKQAFSGGEIAAIAAYMSEISGDKVSISDLYAGKISVFGSPPNDGEPMRPRHDSNVRPFAYKVQDSTARIYEFPGIQGDSAHKAA